MKDDIMTTYHILNGDSLIQQLKQTKINQDFIVCRECFIDGNLIADNSSDFWTIRAKFISETYNISEKDYFAKTVKEFEKLKALPDDSEVCLWFGNDLFCQTNMWFIISLLADKMTVRLCRVFPNSSDFFGTCKGFAVSDSEMLEQSYSSREIFTPKDVELGKNLWTAYKNQDFNKLIELSNIQSNCFRHLDEVCQAHIDRFPKDKSLGRPDKVVKEIIETKSRVFEDVFLEFSKREGIYGFGDLQVKNIYDKQMHCH